VDRESAHEMLAKQAEAKARAEEDQRAREAAQKEEARGGRWTLPDMDGEGRRERAPARPRASNRQTVAEAAMKSVVRSVGSSIGRALVRGILGSLKKGF
ncbi:MAG: helicase HerA-like domain-containing protein, partial [Aliihoeflea sp.]